MATGAPPDEPDFSNITRSTKIERVVRKPLSFPDRSDYVRLLAAQDFLADDSAFTSRPKTVGAVHQHWHKGLVRPVANSL